MSTGTALRNSALLAARLVAGGSLLLAAAFKLKSGAMVFSLSIESFKLVPAGYELPLAYFLPWLELLVGLALVAGAWTREAGVVAVGLLGGFTIGLASVLARGLDVDCGCFGGMFGEGKVGWHSVARNLVFVSAAAATAWWGSGAFALLPDKDKPAGGGA